MDDTLFPNFDKQVPNHSCYILYN